MITGPAPHASISDVSSGLVAPLVAWYRANARVLPWRARDVSPWAVLVSEVMLQQTPVARVVPVYRDWMQRWPDATALAAATRGDAVRMWGKLGYPRRAVRLHSCALAVVEHHGGVVPQQVGVLLTLPGVGAYTARAVAVFAYGQREPVVDTNVRRVVSRAVFGEPAARAPASSDLATVEALLPADPARAAEFSIALMELGALVCTARAPGCPGCPLFDQCAWVAAGSPAYDGPAPRSQPFTGTDRQVRGLLLDVLRGNDTSVSLAQLDASWPDPVQRTRALEALIADGLIEALGDGRYALPG